jgi:chemotaxis protein CheD
MLPTNGRYSSSAWADTPVSSATRYGNVAMERLINVILASGGSRENFEIKIFGGAKVLDINSDVGNENIKFVMAFIKKEGHKVQVHDVGGVCPRKVNYYPSSGRVRVKKLYNLHNNTLEEREKRYFRELQDMPVRGEVDIF